MGFTELKSVALMENCDRMCISQIIQTVNVTVVRSEDRDRYPFWHRAAARGLCSENDINDPLSWKYYPRRARDMAIRMKRYNTST